MMIYVILHALRGRYCVIQLSCCNTNKEIIIINRYVIRPTHLLLILKFKIGVKLSDFDNMQETVRA